MSLITWLKQFQVPRRNRVDGGELTLHYRRIYILPTGNGVSFGVVLLVMLIGSMNYNLSLGYLLTFLLGGMATASILHTFRNLLGLRLRTGRTSPDFAGGTLEYTLLLESGDERGRTDRVRVASYAMARDLLDGSVGDDRLVVCADLYAGRRLYNGAPRHDFRGSRVGGAGEDELSLREVSSEAVQGAGLDVAGALVEILPRGGIDAPCERRLRELVVDLVDLARNGAEDMAHCRRLHEIRET